jgi:glycosyltransferase involved in cell wall biosynthesis
MPQLAILIPAYNCAATIGKTLASLQAIASGWEHVEQVIVCDDASTDETLQVVEGSAFDRCTLTVLRHAANAGEAACYSTMVDRLSAGVEWFLILHADDLALDRFLARNRHLLHSADRRVATISSNYYEFGAVPERLAHIPAEDVTVFRGGDRPGLMHTALIGCWWHISGALINKALWQQFGGRDARFPQLGDWYLILRWQQAGYLVGHSLIPTTKYRVTGGSVSSQSYLHFRDVQERAQIVLALPEVFSRTMRMRFGVRLALATLRRFCKLVIAGRLGPAVRGASVGVAAVFSLMRR